MRLLILTPGIKSRAQLPAGLKPLPGDTAYLTNPLYQASFFADPGLSVLTDDDLSSDDVAFAEIVEAAERIAQGWYEISSVRESLLYRGVNLGSLFTRDSIYFFVALLSARHLYKRLFLTRSFSGVVLVNDGSVWGSMAIRAAKNHGLPVEIHQGWGVVVASSSTGKKGGWIRRVTAFLAHRRALNAPRGGVLYSCAYKFAEPLLRRSRGGLFLRETFSPKAYFESLRRGFTHLVPAFERGEAREKRKFDGGSAYQAIEASISQWPPFHDDVHALWSEASLFFKDITLNLMPKLARTVDVHFEILERTEPSSVVVDEEVIPFNKSLILCAAQRAIPTFAMLHGVPYKKTSVLPSSAGSILAWGESTRERLMGWGLPVEKVILAGAPQFERYKTINREKARQRCRKRLGIPKERKILLYTVMILHTNERPFPKYTRNSMYLSILKETLKMAFRYVSERPDIDLIVKFHPGEKSTWFAKSLSETYPESVQKRIHFVHHEPAAILVAGADFVITCASTIYYEAMLLGTPVRLLDYPDARYCAFMSEDYLNVADPAEFYSGMDTCLSAEGSKAILSQQSSDLSKHFHRQNRNTVPDVIRVLEAGPTKRKETVYAR